jgi:serine protease Do
MLMSFSDALSQVADRICRSTVQVRTRRQGSGSGVIWNSDGLIVTNAHVVRGQHATIELADGRVFPAEVMARNTPRDLVALKIDANHLPAATIADSSRSRVGELVFAVGNPFGSVGVVTTGVIHKIGLANTWIQADVRLAPGNSGGALANAQGDVIGINTMIVEGCGLAIPSEVVQQFLQSRNDRPYLGITFQPVGVMLNRRRAYGLLLTEIESGSPAQSAELLPGDILIGVRGTLFQSPHELLQILENSSIGDALAIELLRGGVRYTKTLILDNRFKSDQAA